MSTEQNESVAILEPPEAQNSTSPRKDAASVNEAHDEAFFDAQDDMGDKSSAKSPNKETAKDPNFVIKIENAEEDQNGEQAEKDSEEDGTAPPSEPPPSMRNTKVLRVPKNIVDFMILPDKDDTMRINITQLRVFVQTVWESARYVNASIWNTASLPVEPLHIPSGAIDTVVVRDFTIENKENEEKRIEFEKATSAKFEKSSYDAMTDHQKKKVWHAATTKDYTVPKQKPPISVDADFNDHLKSMQPQTQKQSQITQAVPIPAPVPVNVQTNRTDDQNRKRPATGPVDKNAGKRRQWNNNRNSRGFGGRGGDGQGKPMQQPGKDSSYRKNTGGGRVEMGRQRRANNVEYITPAPYNAATAGGYSRPNWSGAPPIAPAYPNYPQMEAAPMQNQNLGAPYQNFAQRFPAPTGYMAPGTNAPNRSNVSDYMSFGNFQANYGGGGAQNMGNRRF